MAGDAPNNDSPVIKCLIDEFIIRLQLDLLVLYPMAAELLLDNFHLSWCAHLDICVGVAFLIQALHQGQVLNLNSLMRHQAKDLIFVDRVGKVEDQELVLGKLVLKLLAVICDILRRMLFHDISVIEADLVQVKHFGIV